MSTHACSDILPPPLIVLTRVHPFVCVQCGPFYRTIGEWLVGLLEDINYFGTILPRIPKKIEDSIKVKVDAEMALCVLRKVSNP